MQLVIVDNLREYLGALVAIVGKGIDVINLNLAISLVLPKNCSAHLSNYGLKHSPTDVLSNYG